MPRRGVDRVAHPFFKSSFVTADSNYASPNCLCPKSVNLSITALLAEEMTKLMRFPDFPFLLRALFGLWRMRGAGLCYSGGGSRVRCTGYGTRGKQIQVQPTGVSQRQRGNQYVRAVQEPCV